MSDALTRLAPEVRTLARPSSTPLLAARGEIQRNADLQVAFVQAKAEGWGAEKLVECIQPVLEEKLEGTPEELREAALYLADEYLQQGDGLMIISRETGRALARLSEEDVWQPKPTRREDGSLVQPLPRLRPDLEGFLVQWVFDRAREEKHVASLAPWVASSPAVKQMTHGGRQEIAKRLEDSAPELISQVKGAGQKFLAHFQIVSSEEEIEQRLTPLPRMTALVRTRSALADLKAFNVHYDPLTSQKGVIGTAWVTEMARGLVEACPSTIVTGVESLWSAESEWPHFWVAPPAARDLVQRNDVAALFVECSRILGLTGRTGVIHIHTDSYRVVNREVFDRWEVAAAVDYTFHIDWNRVRAIAWVEPQVTKVVF